MQEAKRFEVMSVPGLLSGFTLFLLHQHTLAKNSNSFCNNGKWSKIETSPITSLSPNDWYRLTGDAGTVLPTSCDFAERCAGGDVNIFSGWISGTLPRGGGNTEVMLKLCFFKASHTVGDVCCACEMDIYVVHCDSSFFLYKIPDSSNGKCGPSVKICGSGHSFQEQISSSSNTVLTQWPQTSRIIAFSSSEYSPSSYWSSRDVSSSLTTDRSHSQTLQITTSFDDAYHSSVKILSTTSYGEGSSESTDSAIEKTVPSSIQTSQKSTLATINTNVSMLPASQGSSLPSSSPSSSSFLINDPSSSTEIWTLNNLKPSPSRAFTSQSDAYTSQSRVYPSQSDANQSSGSADIHPTPVASIITWSSSANSRFPVDGQYGEWGAWSNCTELCSGGTQLRMRTCDNPAPAYGGADCPGPANKTRSCNEHPCPGHSFQEQISSSSNTVLTQWPQTSRIIALSSSEYSPSSYWSSRDVSSSLTTDRSHSLPLQITTSFDDAYHSSVKILSTTSYGEGSSGSTDSAIEKTVPRSIQTLQKSTLATINTNVSMLPASQGSSLPSSSPSSPSSLINDPSSSTEIWTLNNLKPSSSRAFTRQSDAYTSQSRVYSSQSNANQSSGSADIHPTPVASIMNWSSSANSRFPVDGQYGEWGAWSNCTELCSGGTQLRMRTCDNPAPAYGGADCPGPANKTRSCNEHSCPVDGDWTEWSTWSYCNKPCGNGYENRTRSCTNPSPMHGGKECQGDGHQAKICNTHQCPAVAVFCLLRLTEAVWTSSLLDPQSEYFSTLSKEVTGNVKQFYAKLKSFIGVEINGFSKGSVVVNQSLNFDSMSSLELLRLQETITDNGKLQNMPVALVNITSLIVPRRPPVFIDSSSTSSTTVDLSWSHVPTDDLNGRVLEGHLVFYKEATKSFLPYNVHATPPQVSRATVSGLLKFTQYTFRVLAYTGAGNGVPSDPISLTTQEDVPSRAPSRPEAIAHSSTRINFVWEPISEEFFHGILLGYNVTFSWRDSTGMHRESVTVSPYKYSVTLDGLSAYTVYSLFVSGFTSKGCGPQSTVVIARTLSDAPTLPPSSVFYKNMTSISSLSIHWTPVPRDHINGVLLGYIVTYRQSHFSQIPVLHGAVTMRLTVGAEALSVTLGNLTANSIYLISIAGFTERVTGPAISFHAETCRCPKKLYTNYWIHPPYTKSENEGIFSGVVTAMLQWACGECLNGHGNTIIDHVNSTRGRPALKPSLQRVTADIEPAPLVSFPVSGSKFVSVYKGVHRYVHIVDSPGIAFITVPKLLGPGSVTEAVIGCLPLVLFAGCMAYCAGFIIWALDSKRNPEQFSPSFFVGVKEGFWWSFISMTTVGYGDRAPISVAARLFGIAWTLTGLVIIAVLVGTISTSLTTRTIKAADRLYGTEIAAIANSTEFRVGILKNARVNTVRNYSSVNEIRAALRSQEVSGALIDTYVAADQQELLFTGGIRVTRLLDKDFGYGVVLSGDAVAVHRRCHDFLHQEVQQVLHIILNNTRELKAFPSSLAVEQSTGLFDGSSPLFRLLVLILCCTLGCSVLLGLLWHAKHVHVGKRKVQQEEDPRRFLREELSEVVANFYSSINARFAMLKRIHSLERRRCLEQIRKKPPEEKQPSSCNNDDSMRAENSL
ncbi:uncharacterized protein LOC5496379 isoform X2 [Nematostella vectensis]|uniref:uncharacterized protein LOC5496379 isoform X2 n=1 Tax=Nematostella vectensis TaxID=45351 RepID=UPI00207723D6|nr:uncharacterized protein LOC5496379 isoform X2 [Nematostella vectensis]